MVDTKFKSDRFCVVFITDDAERTAVKSKLLGYEVRELRLPVKRIYTKIEPRPTQAQWPPKTLGSLLAWQAIIDSRSRRKIEEHVLQASERGVDCLAIMIESPKYFYAFLVCLGPLQGPNFSKVELRKNRFETNAPSMRCAVGE